MNSRLPPALTSLRRAYVMLLICSGTFLFWVAVFVHNGLHHFSYDDIYWQRTAGAGDWPFGESGPQGSANLLVLLLVMCGLLARVFIPIATLFIIGWTIARWSRFSRPEQRWYGVGSLLAGLITAGVCFLPVSWSMYTWLIG